MNITRYLDEENTILTVLKIISKYYFPIVLVLLFLLIASADTFAQKNHPIAKKNLKSNLNVVKVIPRKFWGQYYKESENECDDQEFAFENLLTISENRVSFGYIVSCVPSIVYGNENTISIKVFCQSEAGSKFKSKIKIEKKEHEVTVDNDVYKQCLK